MAIRHRRASQDVAVLYARRGDVLVMSDTSGRQIVNTGLAHGAPLPVHGNAAVVRQVFESARPMVSNPDSHWAPGRTVDEAGNHGDHGEPSVTVYSHYARSRCNWI
jgi:hypothetical protein